MSNIFLYIFIRDFFFLNLSKIGKFLQDESRLSLTKGNVLSIRWTNDQQVF